MKQERFVYKDEAKKKLLGKYGIVIPVLLVVWLIEGAITTFGDNYRPKYDYQTLTVIDPGNPTLVSSFGIIGFLIGAAFVYALMKMFIQIAKEETPKIEDILLSGFKEEYVRSLVLYFLKNLFIFLWALLLIIPGIIKAYSYSMSFYLLFKKPELSASDAIDESKKLTQGYKGDIFMLDLSYVPLYILGLLTLGIYWLWVYPRHMTARVLYFTEIYEVNYPSSKMIEE